MAFQVSATDARMELLSKSQSQDGDASPQPWEPLSREKGSLLLRPSMQEGCPLITQTAVQEASPELL